MEKSKLKKLAYHLITGKLLHDKFNLAVDDDFTGRIYGFDYTIYGTVWRELPAVFKEWYLEDPYVGDRGIIAYKNNRQPWDGVLSFFNISHKELVWLFQTKKQHPGCAVCVGGGLDEGMTPKEAGEHILSFINRVDVE